MDKDKLPETHLEKLKEPSATEASNADPSKQRERVLSPVDSASTTVPSEKEVPKEDLDKKMTGGKENTHKSHAEKENERKASRLKSQGKGFSRGGGRGGFNMPGKDLNILEGKDDMINPGDDPLSMNQEEGKEKYTLPLFERNQNIAEVEEGKSEPFQNPVNENTLEVNNPAFALFEKDNLDTNAPQDNLANQNPTYYLALNEQEENFDATNPQTEQTEASPSVEQGKQYAFPLFERDEIEVDTDEDSVTNEDSRSFYLELNDPDENSPDDYFPIDLSATEDFAEYSDGGDNIDIGDDGPDIGGDDGGDD